jgi:hypothetical protein
MDPWISETAVPQRHWEDFSPGSVSEFKGHQQLHDASAAFDSKLLTEFAAGAVGTSHRRH